MDTLASDVASDLEALGARLSALEAKSNPSEPPKSSPAPSGALVERMAAFVEQIAARKCFRSDGPLCIDPSSNCIACAARALLAELRKGGGA